MIFFKKKKKGHQKSCSGLYICVHRKHMCTHKHIHNIHRRMKSSFLERSGLWALEPSLLSSATGLFQIKQAVSKLHSTSTGFQLLLPVTDAGNLAATNPYSPRNGAVITHELRNKGREFWQSSKFWDRSTLSPVTVMF